MTTSHHDVVSHLWHELYSENPSLTSARASIEEAYARLESALRDGRQVLVCGNGGSASDAEHIAGELAKPCAIPRPLDDVEKQSLLHAGDDGYLGDALARGLPVWPLVSQSALLTAIANDQGGDLIFAQQVMAYGRPGDVLWALSTSGNSRNVVHALRTAKARGLVSIALTGPGRGSVTDLADVVIAVPGADTPHIQHNHQIVYHSLCLAIEAAFFG